MFSAVRARAGEGGCKQLDMRKMYNEIRALDWRYINIHDACYAADGG